MQVVNNGVDDSPHTLRKQDSYKLLHHIPCYMIEKKVLSYSKFNECWGLLERTSFVVVFSIAV